FVFASGAGDGTAFRAARPEELASLRDAEASAAFDALLWGTIYRKGPIDRAGLLATGTFPPDALDAAITRLLTHGRIEAQEREGVTHYSSEELFIPIDASAGWEAAVYDHFHALVSTICAKLELSAGRSDAPPMGGSTYSFTFWPGHPLERELLDSLDRFRS